MTVTLFFLVIGLLCYDTSLDNLTWLSSVSCDLLLN